MNHRNRPAFTHHRGNRLAVRDRRLSDEENCSADLRKVINIDLYAADQLCWDKLDIGVIGNNLGDDLEIGFPHPAVQFG